MGEAKSTFEPRKLSVEWSRRTSQRELRGKTVQTTQQAGLFAPVRDAARAEYVRELHIQACTCDRVEILCPCDVAACSVPLQRVCPYMLHGSVAMDRMTLQRPPRHGQATWWPSQKDLAGVLERMTPLMLASQPAHRCSWRPTCFCTSFLRTRR
jgi:hypothetical protein